MTQSGLTVLRLRLEPAPDRTANDSRTCTAR
jgi:hypothetical protein